MLVGKSLTRPSRIALAVLLMAAVLLLDVAPLVHAKLYKGARSISSLRRLAATTEVLATAGVEGYVRDESGRPISDVRVIALSKIAALGKVSETKTDNAGHYFISLSAGDYVLVFSAMGYVDGSVDVSIRPGDLARVNVSLKRAKAEFLEDWFGTKFEVALTTEEPWKVGAEATVEVWITVSDMGGNRRVEFRQVELLLWGTRVRKTVPLGAEAFVGGTVYAGSTSFRILDGFAQLRPDSEGSYILELYLEGSYTDRNGFTWPGVTSRSTSIRVYAPPSPVSLSGEMPARVAIEEEFEVKVKVRNEGEYPISNVKIMLMQPYGTLAMGPLDWSKSVIGSGEEAVTTFKLKADVVTTSTVSVSLYYTTLWGCTVSEVGKTLGSLHIGKAPTNIYIIVEPSQVEAGKSVTVIGKIEPPMRAPITLTMRGPEGRPSTLRNTSGPDGTFKFVVELNIEGRYSFVASFSGDSRYEASASNEVYAEAVPPPASPWPYVVIGMICVVVATIATITAMTLSRRGRGPKSNNLLSPSSQTDLGQG